MCYNKFCFRNDLRSMINLTFPSGFTEPVFNGSYADAEYLWSPVFPASPSMPCARSRHSVCVWGGGVFVYGGRGTRGTLKDFWRYDIGELDIVK